LPSSTCPRLISYHSFADHPNITAILAAHLGGQEVGNSIVDVLYGDVNPSGHLPYTIAKEESDYAFADITNSSALLNTSDSNAWQSNFEERLLIDYRHFDYYNLPVQYEFGFGLSYTTFGMSNVSVSGASSGPISSPCPKDGENMNSTSSSSPAPGGNAALWEALYTISTSVTNTGKVAGAAVPQLYLGLPQPANEDVTPVKVLRGFEKVFLQPGESKTVEFPLMRRDISYWDVDQQTWVIGDGDVRVYAGFSSRDVKAQTLFSPISGAGAAKKRSRFGRR
jgi:beta-glucosidase